MATRILKQAHRKVAAKHLTSVAQAMNLEGEIANQAKALVNDLLGQAAALREKMGHTPSEYDLRRIEKAYLAVMHKLSTVRRIYNLSNVTTGKAQGR